MKISGMVVDDSVIFRSQVKKILMDSRLFESVTVAANGKIALQKLRQDEIDLIVLDLEMPVMGGLELLQHMKKEKMKTRSIVFSGVNTQQAKKTMECLEAGASDFIAKPGSSSISLDSALTEIATELIPKIKELCIKTGCLGNTDPIQENITSSKSCSPNKANWPKYNLEIFRPQIIVAASSTGGPSTWESIFREIEMSLSIPMIIVQHMPPVFTKSFADRLSKISGLEVLEAKNGDAIAPGIIHIAPGDFHTVLEGSKKETFIKLNRSEKRNSVRPAADYLFESAASIYNERTLGIVLTGMGEDGKDGSAAIKNRGGAVFIQNKETSVVWGMPGSVHRIEAHDGMGDEKKCVSLISQYYSFGGKS